CSHPGGREGLVCSPLPFLWGTNSRLGCSHPGGREGLVCSPLPFLWGTNSRLG
ncbi:unnamed protein product, partial [Ascophyllum nodosum]